MKHKSLISEVYNIKNMMGESPTQINEGFFKNLINTLFGKDDETSSEIDSYIKDVEDFLSDKNLLTPNIESLLYDIRNADSDNSLNYETLSRTVANVLFKKGDKESNLIKYFNKILKSLETRDLTGTNLPSDEEIEPEEEKSVLPRRQFVKELRALQVELLKMQEWLKDSGKSVVILFEGRDTAGKGSTIRKFTEYLDPKFYNIVVKGIPTPEERENWFTRYANDIEPGKITFFDRSWYNRAVVEPVMGYSSEEEYKFFMENVNKFEKWLSLNNYIIKFWFSITKDTQAKRFDIRKTSPLKYWKFSPNDAKAQEMWDKYTEYKEKTFKQTSTSYAPWTVVDSNDKRLSGLNAIRHVLSVVPYENKDMDNIGDKFPEVITTIK